MKPGTLYRAVALAMVAGALPSPRATAAGGGDAVFAPRSLARLDVCGAPPGMPAARAKARRHRQP